MQGSQDVVERYTVHVQNMLKLGGPSGKDDKFVILYISLLYRKVQDNYKDAIELL